MVKKSLVIGTLVILLFSMTFVSAGFFSDFWGKITGKVTNNTCTDTDGINPLIKGTVCDANGCWIDYCQFPFRVNEYSCASKENKYYIEGFTCDSGYECSDGACILEFAICGNGIVESLEECDGLSAVETCTDLNKNGTCSSSCTWNPCIPTEYCGDGIVNGNEACDDNNTVSKDGCSPTCVIEISSNNIAINQTCTDECSSGKIKCKGLSGYVNCGNFDSDNCLEWDKNAAIWCGAGGLVCINDVCIVNPDPTNSSNGSSPTLTTTTTTASAGGGGSGGGSSGSTSPEVFEETISAKEEIIEETKFVEEVKKIVYSQGNEIKIEIKSEINEDGSSVVREKRTFINKNGEEVKIEIETEVKADGSVILKRKIKIKGNEIESELKILEKFEDDEIKLKAQLSNGNEQEIKIMPDEASEIALEKLKSEGFNIELKEVGEGDNLRAVYIAEEERDGRLFGLFKITLKSEAQIDSETGEIISSEKPWWNFLVIVSKPVGISESLGNQTNATR